MEHCRNRYRFDVAFVMALSLAGLSACGAENGGAGADEPLARAEQLIIPGAAVTQVTRSFTLPAGGALTDVAARCPLGSKVVGGGYSTATVDPPRVYKSVGTKSDWRVSVINLSNTVTGVDVHAQCLSGTNAGHVVVWSPVITVGAGLYASHKVECPAGKILTGGGFSGSAAIHATANTPEQTSAQVVSWAFSAKNMNNFGASSFQVQAVCVQGVSGGTTVQSTGNLILAGERSTFSSAPCPSQTLLSSGGFSFSGAGDAFATGNLRNHQNVSSWTLSVKNGTAPIIASLRSACVELWAL